MSSTIVAECPICFDDIEVTKNCVITECGHKFHASCLLRSVAHSNFACPCCRFELAEKPEESDDGYDDEDDYEEEISDSVLQSVRWLFQRAEGEEIDENEEEEVDEEEEAVVEVPVSYIADNLIAMNYNFEDLVKIFVNESAFTEQDERSLRILDVIDSLVDRYEEENTPTTTPLLATPIVAPPSNTDDEDDDSDDEEVSEEIKSFIPKINFHIVKRYQATSDLCGNN